jgi:hypothetical protein
MSWIRHSQLLANPDSRRIFDLAMPWHGAGALRVRIVIDRMTSAFANEHASVCFQMTDQVGALHKSRN